MSSEQAVLIAVCPGCRTGGLSPPRHPGFAGAPLHRCSTCGTEFASPQPTDARLTEIYSPEYYEPWQVESAVSLRRMKEMSFAPLIAEIERAAASKVLDLGCARGEFLGALQRPGYQLFGVDLNAAAIERAAAQVAGASFHVGTLADGPFPGQQFDAITMIDFLEHVRDPEAELRLARERLAQGGELLISTPRADSVTARLTGRLWPQYREEHLTYFTRAGLTQLLHRVGLAPVRTHTTRKAVTPAYVYGQATAYPLPVVTPIIRSLWRALPLDRIGPRRLWFGEMTVVATPTS